MGTSRAMSLGWRGGGKAWAGEGGVGHRQRRCRRRRGGWDRKGSAAGARTRRPGRRPSGAPRSAGAPQRSAPPPAREGGAGGVGGAGGSFRFPAQGGLPQCPRVRGPARLLGVCPVVHKGLLREGEAALVVLLERLRADTGGHTGGGSGVVRASGGCSWGREPGRVRGAGGAPARRAGGRARGTPRGSAGPRPPAARAEVAEEEELGGRALSGSAATGEGLKGGTAPHLGGRRVELRLHVAGDIRLLRLRFLAADLGGRRHGLDLERAARAGGRGARKKRDSGLGRPFLRFCPLEAVRTSHTD